MGDRKLEKNIIIRALRGGLTINDACERAAISRQSYHNRLNNDKDFSKEVRMAKAQAMLNE